MKKTLLFALALLMAGSLTCAAQGKKNKEVKEAKTTYNSIIDMLRRENGVVIGSDVGNGTMPKIYIRGIGTNTDQFQPLFVVDGIRTSDIMYLLPEDIYSINVIKDGTAAQYGMEGANGVIEIRTKGSMQAEIQAAEAKKAARKNRKVVVVPEEDQPEGQVRVIGVGKIDKNAPLEAMMQVENAAASGDPTVDLSDGNEPKVVIRQTDPSQPMPIFVIDGKVVSSDKMSNLSPDQISSMTILKDEAAVKAWGEEGRNGVIEVVTIKAAKKNKRK